jgi:hypothetical protein
MSESGKTTELMALALIHGSMVQNIFSESVGDRYDGEWISCLKHGKGADFFANGDSYVGEYEAGKPCGQGTYLWKNGSQYEGEF